MVWRGGKSSRWREWGTSLTFSPFDSCRHTASSGLGRWSSTSRPSSLASLGSSRSTTSRCVFLSPRSLRWSPESDLLLLPHQIQRGVLTQEELPSLLVTFQTQEIKAFRDMETGELKVGSPDKVIGVGYAVVIGRIEEELEDEVTGGWKILEVRAGIELCAVRGSQTN